MLLDVSAAHQILFRYIKINTLRKRHFGIRFFISTGKIFNNGYSLPYVLLRDHSDRKITDNMQQHIIEALVFVGDSRHPVLSFFSGKHFP